MHKVFARKSKVRTIFTVLLVSTLLILLLVVLASRYKDSGEIVQFYKQESLLPTNDSLSAVSSADLPFSSSLSSSLPSLSSPSLSSPSSLSLLSSSPSNASINVHSSTEGSVDEVLMFPNCKWPSIPESTVRYNFCTHYAEDYFDACRCDNPIQIRFDVKQIPNNTVADLPVIVIASNRPKYLFRMLRSLCSTPGVDLSLVTVFIDGFYDEPKDVALLFGVNAVQNTPSSSKQGRITQNYKNSIQKTFDSFPNAPFTIILEEDLEVAPDFFSYFSQTRRLLEEDSSIYCVSAWNDNGYEHASEDPALLYRVEIMPGLGWLLSRKLFKDELERRWPRPSQVWHWDWWMRGDNIRKDRESIIPDVSRTYHFGDKGMNMNPTFQENYFAKHKVNDQENVKLRDIDTMKKDAYEVVVHSLLRNATVLDHSKDPCSEDFFPDTTGETYLMFIDISDKKNKDSWIGLAYCLHLWDLDPRGFHNGLWRFFMKHNHILVMGSPYSPYTNEYKPKDITPIKLKKPSKKS